MEYALQVRPARLEGVFTIEPYVFEDFRGEFVETYNKKIYREAGIDIDWLQDDISISTQHVLRGIHGDQHTTKLLSCLADWSARGVRYLNLHELMYEPGTNSAALPGPRRAIVTADGHCSEINPESRMLTLTVMQHVRDEALPLAVNDCSLQSKVRQLRGRRRNLAPLAKAPHEKMVSDQVYESYCAFRDGDEVRYFHPDAREEMCRRYPDHGFVRLVRTAPLSIHDPGKWIVFEPWLP